MQAYTEMRMMKKKVRLLFNTNRHFIQLKIEKSKFVQRERWKIGPVKHAVVSSQQHQR